MMFASRVTRIVPTPSDPPYAVTIRRLSWRQLDTAKKALMASGRDLLDQLGGVGVIKEIQALGGETAVRSAAAVDADAYDRRTVLLAGVVTWRLASEDPAAAVDRTPDEIAAMIDDLEEPVEKALYNAILALSRAPGATSSETQEADAKNG